MAKQIPHFWWDFEYEPDRVIVESSDPKHPIVKSWDGHAEANVSAAELLVKDLREGRASHRRPPL